MLIASNILLGMIQGSVMGLEPLLFLIYIDWISTIPFVHENI